MRHSGVRMIDTAPRPVSVPPDGFPPGTNTSKAWLAKVQPVQSITPMKMKKKTEPMTSQIALPRVESWL